jgi:RNA polymerase sigma-70 factor (ECF subfamily)
MAAASGEEIGALRPRIVRYLARLVGAPEAEDLAQTVLLKATESLPRFRADAKLSTWVYRIATNAALDKLRRKSALPCNHIEFDPDESELPAEAQTPSVEQEAVREEMRACIRDFLERLPENYQAVMVLSEVEGFKNEEIAAILELSLETVKIRLHRARDKLRQDLERGCNFYRDECDELACDRKPAAAMTFRPRR